MKAMPVLRALAVGLVAGTAAWLLNKSGWALPLALGAAVLTFFVLHLTPWIAVRTLDRLILLLRTWHWHSEQGRFHSFGGVPLSVQDDGRYMWMAGDDLQRVLGSSDAEDVLAARHAARWRRDGKGRLWLRVDAVVHHLATAPGRLEPRTVRLRRYLEQDLLFPAAERRRRSETMR